MADVPPFDRDNPNPKFKRLVRKLSRDPSVRDPEALAYTIGLRKMMSGGGGGGGSGGGGESFWKRGWERIKKGAKSIKKAFQADTYRSPEERRRRQAPERGARREDIFQQTAPALEEMRVGFEELEG